MERQTLSLCELNGLVRQTLDLVMPDEYWVRAEIARVNESRGHCYLELVQKDEHGNGIVAKANGTIWASRWQMLRRYFERTTGQRLTDGLQVLVKAKATFHELYGYSLNISDLDPTFTLGGIAKRRREIMQQLEAEGVADMNKQLSLPRLLQRIAVVSSANAAGYGDFCNQLHSNRRGLAFHTELFQATMQGNDVENSVVDALCRIAEQTDRWDAVVIIRGGGAVVDLAGFDTLLLAEYVAQFPLPVITGIGHERDDTVIDLVAHTRVKTPTAAAELLIHHQEAELAALEGMAERLVVGVGNMLRDADMRMKRLTATVPTLFARVKSREDMRLAAAMMSLRNSSLRGLEQRAARLDMLNDRLKMLAMQTLDRQRSILQMKNLQIEAASPERILNMGYSITRVNGHAVRDAAKLRAGDTIETVLANGSVTSVVQPSRAEQ